MATFPFLVWNFNENNATSIKDYSTNGLNGVGTGLTIQSSAEVGNECVFNAAADSCNAGRLTNLNGKAEMAMHMKISSTDLATTYTILSKVGQLRMWHNFSIAAGIIQFDLNVASGTATVFGLFVSGVYQEFDIVYIANILFLVQDGVVLTSDATQSGVIASNTNNFRLGANGAFVASTYLINELRMYDQSYLLAQSIALMVESNGLLTDNGNDNDFELGDLIGANLTTDAKYAVVSFKDGTAFRMNPLTTGILNSMQFQRVGSAWDVDRKHNMTIDEDNGIVFYEDVQKTTDVANSANNFFSLNREGPRFNPVNVVANYNALPTDFVIIGAPASPATSFTITLPAAPATGKYYEIWIISNTGGTVTIAGNGNNINGAANLVLTVQYDKSILYYSGIEWLEY